VDKTTKRRISFKKLKKLLRMGEKDPDGSLERFELNALLEWMNAYKTFR